MPDTYTELQRIARLLNRPCSWCGGRSDPRLDTREDDGSDGAGIPLYCCADCWGDEPWPDDREGN